MRWSFAVVWVLVLAGAAASVQAHHSFSATYDGNKPITVRGKISKLGWRNPHTHFYVDVLNQKGETVTWEVETASTLVLSRAGMKREEFIGADVIVKGFLARDGTPTMVASSFVMVESKKEFQSEELAPAAR
jgi:hypothetical protein